MEFMRVLLFALTALFACVIHILVVIWRQHKKLEMIPTNRPSRIFGHTWMFLVPRNRFLATMKQLAKDNEPFFTVWFGPKPMLIVIQPKHVEIILGNAKNIDKAFIYKFFEPTFGNSVAFSAGDRWHWQRKLLAPTFHYKILENFLEVFSKKSWILVKKLEKNLGCESFDMFHYITLCTLDIICETAMGIDLNVQDQENHLDYVQAVHEITGLTSKRMYSPWLYPDVIYNLSPSGRRAKELTKILHNFTNKVINERKMRYEPQKTEESDDDIGKKKKLAFLDLLLEISENGDILTDEQIRQEVDTFMAAGHDAMAVGVSWALQNLASYPDIQDRVYEEVESIFQGSDRPPTMKDLNEMKYLEQVMKESHRMYPPLPVIGRELKQDIELEGIKVPAPMTVMIHIMTTHRLPEYYPEPDKFDPDNFLPERVAARHPYAYIPFSAGPRNCIGQKFALLEEKTIISYVLRHYKLEATGEIPIGSPDVVLRPENGIRIRTIPRKGLAQISVEEQKIS